MLVAFQHRKRWPADNTSARVALPRPLNVTSAPEQEPTPRIATAPFKRVSALSTAGSLDPLNSDRRSHAFCARAEATQIPSSTITNIARIVPPSPVTPPYRISL